MKLHIEMFGEFTIYVDGEKNFQYEGRTRKLWNLLQYLLVNRNRPVPQAELFSIAHLDGKKGKPENSLKNLIYRLRGLLEESDLPMSTIGAVRPLYQTIRNAFRFASQRLGRVCQTL